jgi:multidrug efflux pump subunit AcrA (membrane-fusion protein)
MKRIWIVVGIIVGVIVIGMAGYLGFSSSSSKASSGVQAPQTAIVTKGDVNQSVTAPGSVVNYREAVIQMPFDGKLTEVEVQPGDTVKAGQVLAQFDSTTQELALATAKMNLAELTSPEAIANAELAVTSAQGDVINTQTALNNQQYWENNALIQDQYANLVIAKANLDKAQTAYDRANVGAYINNSDEAALYQALYAAQQKYHNAEYYYSLYSQHPTQRQLNQAQANLDLANAKLINAQNYLAALTSGGLPADATGSALDALIQAKLAVRMAQDNLDATKLTALFDGVVLESNAVADVIIPAGTTLFTIHDPRNIEMETTVTEEDFAFVKVGQQATVYFDALPTVVGSGVVSRIVPVRAPGNSPLYYVYMRLGEIPEGLVNGMTVDSHITIASRQGVLCLPRSVVHASADNKVELQVWNGTVTENREVVIGLRGDTTDEIISGLTVGEQVVVK